MKILEDLLSVLNYDCQVKDIRVGPFQTAVVTRNCGLASTPHDSGPHHQDSPVKEAGALLEMNPRALANMAKSEIELEASIGMATIN